MKIEYTINEVYPRLFSVVIPDSYTRAMVFCRVQEFYESPNSDFRGKHFNIWDFIEWYSRQKKDAFTYPFDWGGFNIPLPIAWECYEGRDRTKKGEKYNGVRSMPDTWKSKWDETMKDIVWMVQSKMFNKKNRRDMNAYIIGSADTEGWTFKHEICHGLYYTNSEYKDLVNEITQTIPLADYIKFKNNLIKMGYTDSVVDDEIQAYLNFGHDWPAFAKGVSKKLCKTLNKTYQNVFNNFTN